MKPPPGQVIAFYTEFSCSFCILRVADFLLLRVLYFLLRVAGFPHDKNPSQPALSAGKSFRLPKGAYPTPLMANESFNRRFGKISLRKVITHVASGRSPCSGQVCRKQRRRHAVPKKRFSVPLRSVTVATRNGNRRQPRLENHRSARVFRGCPVLSIENSPPPGRRSRAYATLLLESVGVYRLAVN